MQPVLYAGLPKSGNTLIGKVMQIAGGLLQRGWRIPGFGVYDLRLTGVMPSANLGLPGDHVCIKVHDSISRTVDLNLSFF